MNWLLLRGLARQSRHWLDFPARLMASGVATRVLTLDAPGFGTSPQRYTPSSVALCSDLLRAEFLPHVGEGECWSILGISFGGMMALDWLARYPDDFAKGVIINTSAADVALPWQRFQPHAALRVPALLLAGDVREREAQLLHMTTRCLDDMRFRDVLDAYQQIACDQPPSRRNILTQLLAASRFLAPDMIDVPVGFIASGRDELVDPVASHRLARRYGAWCMRHPVAGHDLPLDDPEWLISVLNAPRCPAES